MIHIECFIWSKLKLIKTKESIILYSKEINSEQSWNQCIQCFENQCDIWTAMKNRFDQFRIH